MMFHLNGKPIDALAMVLHKSSVAKVGRTWVKKLRPLIKLVELLVPFTNLVHVQVM